MNDKEMRDFEINYIQSKISSMKELQNDIFETVLKRKKLSLENLMVLSFEEISCYINGTKTHYFYIDGETITFIVTFNVSFSIDLSKKILIEGFEQMLSVIEEIPQETSDRCKINYNIQTKNINHE